MRIVSGVLCCIVLLLLGTSLHAQACTEVANISTGFDEVAGVILGDGSEDCGYVVSGLDVGYGPECAAVVPPGWPLEPGVWVLNNERSRWIGFPAWQSNAAGGTYVFETRVTVPEGMDPLKAVIIGRWAVDNMAVELRVNGQSTGISHSDFHALESIPEGAGLGMFSQGENVIQFHVLNGGVLGGDYNPCGLRLEALVLTSQDQQDCNGNGVSDACEILGDMNRDCDGNGVPDECDIASGLLADTDGDGFPDTCDNCPAAPNPEQTDMDGDGVGDACEINRHGWIQTNGWNILMPLLNPGGCAGGGEEMMLQNWVAPHVIGQEDPKVGTVWEDIDFGGSALSTGWGGGNLFSVPTWFSNQSLEAMVGTTLPNDDFLDYQRIADILGYIGIAYDNVLGIATTYVRNKTGAPLPVEICDASDDSIQVWVDNQVVGNKSICRGIPALVCHEGWPAILPSGVSRISVLVWEGGGGWGFRLGIARQGGGPLYTEADADALEFLGTGDDATFGSQQYLITRTASELGCPADAYRIKLTGAGPGSGPVTVTERILADSPSDLQITDGGAGTIGDIRILDLRPVGEFDDHRMVGYPAPCSPINDTTFEGTTYSSVSSNGGETWADGDSFEFAYRSIEGDFDMAVLITGKSHSTNVGRWGKFGLMARQSLDNDARYTAIQDHLPLVEGDDSGRVSRRSVQHAVQNTQEPAFTEWYSDPNDWSWLKHPSAMRLVRQGNVVYVYISNTAGTPGYDPADDGNWVLMYVDDWGRTAPSRLFVGFGNSNHPSAGCAEQWVDFELTRNVGASGSLSLGKSITWNVDRSVLGSPGLSYKLKYFDQRDVDFRGDDGDSVIQGVRRLLYDLPTPYIGPNGNLYDVVWVPQGITWPKAFAAAQMRTISGLPGHLATIANHEEDEFLEALRQEVLLPYLGAYNPSAWVGGFQLPDSEEPYGGWTWVNDEGSFPGWNWDETYANWQWGQPDDGFCYHCEKYLTIGLNSTFGWNDDGYIGADPVRAYAVEYDRLTVAIDIKPGSPDNPVNLKAEGVIPVAILSSPIFDATTVDPATVRFGPTGTEAPAVHCSAGEDANLDGRLDMTCQFNVLEARIECGDTSAMLQAQTTCGYPLQGAGSLKTLGCPPYDLDMVALQDVSRLTEVFLTVNVIAKGFKAPTMAEEVHLKSYDLLGRLGWTDNVSKVPLLPNPDGSSTGTLQYTDLERGQPLQAHVQVKNSKFANIENLLADATVLLRPDLTVEAVQAPENAYTGQIVNIVAGIQQLNGDLGATATVYLLENGNVIDQATGVQVDPYGLVGVTFATIFTEVGTHSLTVSIQDVTPGDYDPSNNEKSFSIEVTRPENVPVQFYAYYDRYEYDYLDAYENDYEIYKYEYLYKTEYLEVDYNALPIKFVFPIDRITLDITVDGELRESHSAQNIDGYSYEWGNCYLYQSASGYLAPRIYFYAYKYKDTCSGYNYEYSYAYFYRSAYKENYHSYYHDKIWGGGWDDSYSWENGTFLDAASSVDTNFVIQDDQGSFGGKASIPSLSQYGYEDEWDLVDNGTHYWGHNKSMETYGYNSGMTTFESVGTGGTGGEARFIRGDVNADGLTDVSDAIVSLAHQFLGGRRPRCLRAADANGDGLLDVTDPIYLLTHLFQGTRAPPAPYPGCGLGAEASGLTCEGHPPCQ